MALPDLNNSLAIRSTRFFMKFTGFWLWNDRRSKFIMDASMIYTHLAIFITLNLTAWDLWFTRRDFHQAAYAACNVITIVMIIIKLVTFSIKRVDFVNLIKFCYEHFWNVSIHDSPFNGIILQQCDARCVYFVGTFTMFAQCTVFTYTLYPILENIGKNESDRILPFTIWLHLPTSTTPYFEILFIIEILALIHCGICYFCFDNLLCIMNVHAAGQFRILQGRFEKMCCVNEYPDLFPDSEEPDISFNNTHGANLTEKLTRSHDQFNELKNCVRKHRSLIHFTKMVEDVYTFVILGQVVIFSLLICLVSYQAILAEGTSFSRRMIFIAHSAGTFTQLFMFTLTCDDLSRESEEVAEAAYRAQWYCSLSDSANRRFARDLIFVIMRARRPCCLTAGGFFPISLETFTTILSTAISYLTLLRKGQDDVSN